MSVPVINAGCACETDNGIWFVHYVVRILMFYDLKEGRITRARIIPKSNDGIMSPYSALVVNDDKLYLFPDNSDSIWVYDIIQDEFEKIKIDLPKQWVFRGAYKYGGYIYVIPYTFDGVIKIDLNNHNWWKLPSFASASTEYSTNSSSVYLSSKIICSIPKANFYAVFNMENEHWERIHIKDDKVRYSFIGCGEKDIFAFDKNSYKIIKINYSGDKLGESDSLKYNSVSVVALPSGGVAVSFTRNGEIQYFDSSLCLINKYNPPIINDSLNSPYLHTHWVKGKSDVFGITKANEIVHFDRNNEFRVYMIKMSSELWNECGRIMLMEDDKLFTENSLLNLDKFIQVIQKWH